jgi:very-short-patch-repair endonuclease
MVEQIGSIICNRFIVIATMLKPPAIWIILPFGYIAGFWCLKKQLAVEVDGKSHENRGEYNLERDTRLANVGIKTVRFSAADVFEKIDIVIAKIQSEFDNP